MAEKKQVLRLDKYLADLSIGTRSEVKQMIKSGRVLVDGIKCLIPETKVHMENNKICVDGCEISLAAFEYFMLNKPAGVVSATRDKYAKTVLDLITDATRKDLFPVGRLDKDTEGLLLITNDGELSHQLLSPKKHVDKKYFAIIEGIVKDEDVEKFKEGLVVEEEFTAMPAKLEILTSGPISEVYITIKEGKFHQIKRMFHAVGKEVIFLKRLSMGPLVLDETLKTGEFRPLTKEEIETLKSIAK